MVIKKTLCSILKHTCTWLFQGLFAENKEKLITGAITALLAMEGLCYCTLIVELRAPKASAQSTIGKKIW